MDINLKRFTLEGGEASVSFIPTSKVWLVKNFSEGDVYVSFATPLVEEKSIKLPSGTGQFCEIDERSGSVGAVNTIYLKGTGEVEVQQL